MENNLIYVDDIVRQNNSNYRLQMVIHILAILFYHILTLAFLLVVSDLSPSHVHYKHGVPVGATSRHRSTSFWFQVKFLIDRQLVYQSEVRYGALEEDEDWW